MNKEIMQQIESEVKSLKGIVEDIFFIDLASNKRKRDLVNGRMVYSKILRDRGLKFDMIGESINKDHSTICYYVSRLESHIVYDKNLYSKYRICKDLFLDNRPPLQLKNTEEQLRYEISKLRSLIKRQDSEQRFKNVISILGDSVPVGEEKFIEDKIRSMLKRIRRF